MPTAVQVQSGTGEVWRTRAKVLEANPAVCFGRTWGLQGSSPSQKWFSSPIFGQEARQKMAAPGRTQWLVHCGTNILQKPEWSRKNTPLEFVSVLARRLGLGQAGVGKGNPPQRLRTEIVSAPIHSTGMEGCGARKQNAKKAERNNIRSTTLRFYYSCFHLLLSST